jgi:hypothetical protein
MPLDIPNVPGGDPQISRLLQSMSNDQKEELIANLLSHKAQHTSFLYGQMKGVIDENGNAVTDEPSGNGLPQEQRDGESLMADIMSEIQSQGGATDMSLGQGGEVPGA